MVRFCGVGDEDDSRSKIPQVGALGAIEADDEELKRFAAMLGWDRLQRIDKDLGEEHGVVTHYEDDRSRDNRWDFFFMINHFGPEKPKTYSAAVYAMRYRIWSGWRRLTLTDEPSLAWEAERTGAYLRLDWFTSPTRRRQYRQQYPACANWSWKRIRDEGPKSELMAEASIDFEG